MLPKCCAEHQKPGTFQRFSPTFQKLFLKSDLFDSLNGLRYAPSGYGWGEQGSETENCHSLETTPKTRGLPAVRLFLPRRTLPGCTLCWAVFSTISQKLLKSLRHLL